MDNLVRLRELLALRFPNTRLGVAPTSETEVHPTGVPAFDELLGGGLPCGELTELVAPGHGSGSAQALHAMLRAVSARGEFMALVDGADSLDVGAFETDVLARLLWVRCRNAEEALHAADLLLRDRNFPLVVLDLKMNSTSQLRRIASSAWHRFSRLVEHNKTSFLVITPVQLVGNATSRVRLESHLKLETLTQEHGQIVAQLRFELLRNARPKESSEFRAQAS